MELYKNLQLAKTVDMLSIKFPCRAELKMDGVRAFLYKNKFYSRKGHEIVLPDITSRLTLTGNLFMDMEITLKTGRKTDRATVSGIINSAMKGGHDKIDQSLLYFNVFDCLDARDFASKSCNIQYSARVDTVNDYVRANQNLNFRMVAMWLVASYHELLDLYDRVVENGYEGLVVKQGTSYYQFKRTKQWARFKPTKTADLLCVGATEGQGKYEGMIGALMLSGMVEDKTVIVKVGSGMTDYDRGLNPEDYIGKTIEVKYDSVTQDKSTGQHSLFQPRFKCVRIDK